MRYFGWGVIADFVRRLNTLNGLSGLRLVQTIDCPNRGAGSDGVTDFDFGDEADCWIYRVVDSHTPAADSSNCMPNLRRSNPRNET